MAAWPRGDRTTFAGQTALITGGASGIGQALGARLVELGARVVLADIDGEGVARAAAELSAGRTGGAAVEGHPLDVVDEQAFRLLVDSTVDRHGRLDLLFNNAGIGLGGPAEWLTAAHWDRIIDVNLRGVVNGVLAAYPKMVEQGRGHIVNTASGVGLVAPPFVVPYAATKHAVVGLSTGLRLEAALRGVRVSVVCPGMVDTAILDQPGPDDLRQRGVLTPRQYLEIAGQRPVPVDRFARSTLDAVARNRAVIVGPFSSKLLWHLHRISPALTTPLLMSIARKVDRRIDRSASAPAGG